MKVNSRQIFIIMKYLTFYFVLYFIWFTLHRNCLSVILNNSVFKMTKNYYPQVFLKEWKKVVKEKKNKQIYWW